MGIELEGKQRKSVSVEGGTVKIIKKGGFFAAQREKALPIRNITSVEVKKPGPFVVGFIQFSIAGGKTRDSSLTMSGGAYDACRDENSVIFNGADKYEIALKIKSYIETFAQPDDKTTIPTSSIADEITKLKKLMDDGVLTNDEFNAKKKQLLGI